MKFFLSGEISGNIDKEFTKIILEVSKELEKLEHNNYGNEVEEIGVIPIIIKMDPEFEAAGFFKERKLFQRKNKEADFRLRIDYESFESANYAMKKILIIKNIIQSIRILATKATVDFDAKKLEKDILNLFHLEEERISELKI